MASGFSGPALDLLAVFCETSRDEIHREPAEDDIWRAEVHPEATDSGPGDSSDLQPPEPPRVGAHGVRAPRVEDRQRHVEGAVVLDLTGWPRRPWRHHPSPQASDTGSGSAGSDVHGASRLPAGRGSTRLGDADVAAAGDDPRGPSALEGLPADLPLPGLPASVRRPSGLPHRVRAPAAGAGGASSSRPPPPGPWHPEISGSAGTRSSDKNCCR